jgi:hypothetical protein
MSGGADIVHPDTLHDTECSLKVTVNGKVKSLCLDENAVKGVVKHVLATSSNDAKVAEKVGNIALNNIDNLSLDDQKKTAAILKDITDCPDQKCVLDKGVKAGTITSTDESKNIHNFKTPGPANSDKWATNHDIDKALSGLAAKMNASSTNSQKHKHLEFQMIDFAGVPDPVHANKWAVQKTRQGANWVDVSMTPTELGKLNMADVIKQGYTSFSVVINTDIRTNSGEHWFALFCDFRTEPYTVEYFNSSGNKPKTQIQEWMNKTTAEIEDMLKTTGSRKKVKQEVLSGMVHQRDTDSECGPFSMYYIWNRMMGVPPQKFQQTRVTDAQVLTMRKHFWKPK